MLHPKERARSQARDRVAALERERLQALRERRPFERYAELAAAEAEMHVAHEGVENTAPCERCGKPVDLDDPSAGAAVHVTSMVRPLDFGVDFQHFTQPERERFATAHGLVLALEPGEQDEIARCASCADHLLTYLGRAPAFAAATVEAQGRLADASAKDNGAPKKERL